MYAIAYDLNTEAAERHGAWAKIARVLEGHGFTRRQGSIFYGDANTSSMTCARAVLDLYDKFPWFWEVVRDMRMLRISEQSGITTALRLAAMTLVALPLHCLGSSVSVSPISQLVSGKVPAPKAGKHNRSRWRTKPHRK